MSTVCDVKHYTGSCGWEALANSLAIHCNCDASSGTGIMINHNRLMSPLSSLVLKLCTLTSRPALGSESYNTVCWSDTLKMAVWLSSPECAATKAQDYVTRMARQIDNPKQVGEGTALAYVKTSCTSD